ncbi:MAG: response regulator [Acidobacteriota bacterium]|nr:response regulator [Acidobacteriota bacterium]
MKRILVVEDNEDNFYLMKFIFEKAKFVVLKAKDGLSGVKLAIQEKPDMILMDIQLPDIDGLEVTRRIRASEKGHKVPIIALTSYAMPGDREKALAAGCTGYVTKPIDPETFMEEIERYL